MRTILYIAIPCTLAAALYIGAIAPAIAAIEAMGASIAAQQQGR